MRKALLTLLVTPLTQFALAAGTNNDCGRFTLQISNITDSVCVLTSTNVNHGNLISSPPGTIMPNYSMIFYMEQTIIGPDITLSYQCGNDNVTFTSKQDLCFLAAGPITGTVQEPLPVNIKASYTAIEGSSFWRKPGRINWQISKI